MLNPCLADRRLYPPDLQWKRQAHVGSARTIPFIDSRLLLDTVNQVIKADDDGKEPLPTVNEDVTSEAKNTLSFHLAYRRGGG
jgi:hypothetical protein